MSAAARRTRRPNSDLVRLIAACGVSHKQLARRVNELAALRKGVTTKYVHTSVLHWKSGMRPRPPVASLIAEALGERLGRAARRR